ncbi:hypothetical protein ACQKPE_18845 [Pseudomonas sp. NPDC089554]|uniref:hypothetical protein n=1 Tax=Pseudomonas sp. NPDC089554 TaxID=3390653 RepID=UPI003D08AC58
MKLLPAIAAALTLSAVTGMAQAAADALISIPDASQSKWQKVDGTNGAVSYANVEGDLFGKGP